MSTFNSPANSQFKPEDHNGKLLIISPTEYLTGVKTTFGEKDAVEAKIVIVNEGTPADSEVVEAARIFSGPMIGATKPFIGKGMVLGRLGQGQPKPGQKPPWLLADPTDADREKAQAYLNSTAPQI